jgi:hypothetical protein
VKVAVTTQRHNPQLRPVLARALILAAWADGTIQPEERRFLEEYLKTVPRLNSQGLARLHGMMRNRPLRSEMLPTFSELHRLTSQQKERDYVLHIVEHILRIDGPPTDEETLFLEKLKRLIAGNEETFYQEMGNIIQSIEF